MDRATVQINPTQIRRLFALGKKLGFAGDDLTDMLRDNAASITGKRSLKSLSAGQAKKLTGQLQLEVDRRFPEDAKKRKAEYARSKKKPTKTAISPGKLSHAQLAMIRGLAKDATFNPHQLRDWLRTYYGVDHEEWLTPKLAAKVIEGLKAMINREGETKE